MNKDYGWTESPEYKAYKDKWLNGDRKIPWEQSVEFRAARVQFKARIQREKD